ncbi:MAG TPA: LysM domain-containing protein [Oligoflexus sp.]|uniref:LysM peptidoglycan-binding domain-containing protein n=1 Tax=Oligoflexus sp. TaxID=1971216 RepID=UPI002D41EE2E|nr:LysM domain-containing protein [Oligoflexus sp.]HYX35022.1 LysM domain-containing protein [Oligoflexus sp.]
MRSQWVRLLCLASLMFSLQFLNLGCSSSSSGEEGTEEEVAATNEEQAAAENNAAEGEGEQAANNEQMANNETNGAETNGLNNAEGANQAENNGMNNGLNDGGNAMAENNQGQQGGEEDLQQIIEEMNTANNNQLPANNGNQGMMNNGGNAMADNGMGNAAMDSGMNAAMNQASSAPMEAAPAAGGAVSGTPVGPGLPELGSKMSYVVQKGDTLGKIAARIFGDSNKWTEIANFTGIANPRLIYPGDVVYYQLTEQSMQFASTYESVKRSEVQIQQGDTLATIAGRVFGNSSLWKLIWRHNDMIDNPDRLTAGTTLYYVDPASMASKESKTEQKFVKGKTQTKSGKLLTVSKVKTSKAVLEVANDSLDDLFSQTVSKDFLKRT